MRLVQFKEETATNYTSNGQFSFPVVEPTTIEPGARVLVVAPHQDDEVLGCGGTIFQYTRRGATVKVLYMTDGSRGGDELSGPELSLIRKHEAWEGLLELGCVDATFLDYPDTELKCDPEVVVKVMEVIEDFGPTKVFVPFFFEIHPDHVVTGKLVAHALQWYPKRLEIYNYEVWTPFFPNVIVDITRSMDAKLNALSKHQSQIRIINYVEKVRGLNAYRSITAGRNVDYCEAFLKASREEHINMAHRLGILD
jgi:LmbE family N-acetylglucosaminyl deacetylase